MYKVGDEVSVKGEITKVCESGVVVKAHYFGEAYFDRSNMDLIGKTYEQGLSDAWELAKKITVNVADGGFQCDVLDKIFGSHHAFNILLTNTAAEALAKIEAYEKEKEIKVGDVVKHTNERIVGVVTMVTDVDAYITWTDGSCGHRELECLIKTGKHIDIESLLRQIGE